MYISGTVEKYLNEAASRSPTPGGGSVSALAGALGAAMSSMVANFTLGKDKYKEVEEEVTQILLDSEKLREKLARLTELDSEIYRQVSVAFQKVAVSEKEKKEKSKAIQQACKGALEVPLEALKCCYEVLKLNSRLVDIGNVNLISDVGVSVILSGAALEGAVLNVEINLASIKDEKFKARIEKEFKPLLAEAGKIKRSVLRKVKGKMK